MMKKLLLWLLSLIFGSKVVAAGQGAVSGYQQAEQAEAAQAVARVKMREDRIDADTMAQKTRVDGAADADLDAELDGVLDRAERANRGRPGPN